MHDELVRLRALEISRGHDAGTPEEDWLRAEREFTVAHDYDTPERDLEQLGMTLSRLPSEAGVEWRLTRRGVQRDRNVSGSCAIRSAPSTVLWSLIVTKLMPRDRQLR